MCQIEEHLTNASWFDNVLFDAAINIMLKNYTMQAIILTNLRYGKFSIQPSN